MRRESQEKLRGVAEARQRLAVEAQARRKCTCTCTCTCTCRNAHRGVCKCACMSSYPTDWLTSCDSVIYDLSQVHQLLEAARSEENLCRMFDGWAAWC